VNTELSSQYNEKLELLKWNYERCQEDYNSKDQMINDIVYKMSQVLVIHTGAITLPFLAKISNFSIILPYMFLILGSGIYYLFFLLISLVNLTSCREELQNQCQILENEIQKSYITSIKDIFFNSNKYKMPYECIKSRNTISFLDDRIGKKYLNLWAAFLILILWTIVMIYMIYLMYKSYIQ